MTISRRLFIGSVASTVVLASTGASGQQAGRIPRVAFVANFSVAEGMGPDPVDLNVRTFVHGLRDRQLDAAARALGLDVLWLGVDAPENFPAAFATIVRTRASAIYATATHVNDAHAELIADFALKHRLPSFGFPDKGMLLGYESDEKESLRRAAVFVKKTLDGAKPGEIPFEQPTKFELVINLKPRKRSGSQYRGRCVRAPMN